MIRDRIRWIIAGLLCMLVNLTVCAQTSPLFPVDFTYQLIADNGQKPNELVVDGWQSLSLPGMPLTEKNVWLRADFAIIQPTDSPQGLFVAMLGAYEVYWDGELIGQNGKVGRSKETEKPGQIESVFFIKDKYLTPGNHTLLLRVSSQHLPEHTTAGLFWTAIDSYPELVNFSFSMNSLPMVMSGALFLIALYFIFLYIKVEQEMSYLLFGLLNFSILLLFIAESWRGLWGYSYDWHIPRLNMVLFLSTIVAVLLTLFFATFFRFSTSIKRLVVVMTLLLLGTVLLVMDGYDNRSLYVVLISFSVSFVLTLFAAWQKQTNARVMVPGLLLCIAPLIINTHAYMEQYFFVTFSILIMLMLYSLLQTMRFKQEQLVEYQLNASRLELELVKRNLQPHFMLNTLTAVEEWIEQSPKTAVIFIQALADEFRQLSQMSSKTLIRLEEEVSLCTSHVKVMGFRNNINFKFETDLPEPQALTPPGVLLTLLENAMTHNNYQQQHHAFCLSQRVDEKRMTLIFKAPVCANTQQLGLSTGTGKSYIQARLQESFADSWQFTESERDGYWVSVLSFPVLEKGERQ